MKHVRFQLNEWPAYGLVLAETANTYTLFTDALLTSKPIRHSAWLYDLLFDRIRHHEELSRDGVKETYNNVIDWVTDFPIDDCFVEVPIDACLVMDDNDIYETFDEESSSSPDDY